MSVAWDQPHTLQTDCLRSCLYYWIEKHFPYPGSRWILRPHPTSCDIRFVPAPPHSNFLILLWKYGKPWRVSYNLNSHNVWMQMNENEEKAHTKVLLPPSTGGRWRLSLRQASEAMYVPNMASMLCVSAGGWQWTLLEDWVKLSRLWWTWDWIVVMKVSPQWWPGPGMPVLTGWLKKSWGPWHVSHPWRLHSRVLWGK